MPKIVNMSTLIDSKNRLRNIIINHKKETIMKKITIIITTICIMSTMLYATEYIVKMINPKITEVVAPANGDYSEVYKFQGRCYIDNPDPEEDTLVSISECNMEFTTVSNDLYYKDGDDDVYLNTTGSQEITVKKGANSISKPEVEAVFKLEKSSGGWESLTIKFAATIAEAN